MRMGMKMTGREGKIRFICRKLVCRMCVLSAKMRLGEKACYLKKSTHVIIKECSRQGKSAADRKGECGGGKMLPTGRNAADRKTDRKSCD